MENFSNLVQIVDFIDQSYNNPLAFNFKKDDNWINIPTQKFASDVKALSLALKNLRIQKNTGFAILAKPSPIWLEIDLAIIANGAVSVPIFPDISHQNLLFEIQNADIKYVFCDCPENLKILEESGHKFEKIIVYGCNSKAENIISFEDLLISGIEIYQKNPYQFNDLIQPIKDEDLATIIYTSGSTGVPKGVEITHRNLISQIHSTEICFPLDANKDAALSFLPLAHIFERMVMYFYVTRGISIYFADDTKKVGGLLKETNPTLITVVPRLLEKVYSKMQSGVAEASFIKKLIGKAAFNMAPSFAEQEDRRIIYEIFNALV